MAARFWVGGTGTWDATDTTHWSATTGGAGGVSVPGTGDTVTLDAVSGGGTVTVNTTVAVQSITCGAFTGTLDFSANNNNVTLSAAGGFSGSGTGVRTINLGNGSWTLSAASSASWTMTTTTNLTFNANLSTISFTGAPTSVQSRSFLGGGLSYNAVVFAAAAGGTSITGANTIATLDISAPNYVTFPATLTNTITNAFNWIGSSSGNKFTILPSGPAGSTVSVASGVSSISGGAIRGITFTGGGSFVANNSFDLGGNTGITITPPTMTRSRGWSGFA